MIIAFETELLPFAPENGQMVGRPESIKYSPPTKFTETCVLNKRLRHNGNPVLTWCMSNIEVAKDGNGNIKPIKPKGKNKSESKRIDGGVALIMAMAKYLEGIQRPKKSVYDTPGRLNEWNKT